MARPLRIEYPGALYHVTARGNARADIYLGDGDRRLFLDLLAQAAERYDWLCHAYCLMDNHYHLLVETGRPTPGRGMRHLGQSTQKRSLRRAPLFVDQQDNQGPGGKGKFMIQDLTPCSRHVCLPPARNRRQLLL